MAEYVKFRWTTAKLGASMALLALIAGVAEKARSTEDHVTATPAASISLLKLTGLSKTISSNFLKVEKKLLKIESSITGFEKSIARNYYKASQVNAKFLKITDANLKYLKITDANAQYLKATAAANLIQGKGSVVSGAVASVGAKQQLLSLPGGIIVVSIESTPGAGSIIVVHNATANTLVGAVSMGDGSVSKALTLTANQDTLLPSVLTQTTAEIRLQIFPAGSFTNVVSILIGLTPNPATQQPEAVAQAFTGGV
jgi:hypothetical protein